MAFYSRAMATGLATQAVLPGEGSSGADPESATGLDHQLGTVESRLQRIATTLRERQLAGEGSSHAVAEDALAVVFVNGPGLGWANGGFRNGGFYNGGFRNGGFYNGGFRNGGFYNGGFRNGGFRNGW